LPNVSDRIVSAKPISERPVKTSHPNALASIIGVKIFSKMWFALKDRRQGTDRLLNSIVKLINIANRRDIHRVSGRF